MGTYQSNEEVCQFLLAVCELDVGELGGFDLAGCEDFSPLECGQVVDQTDGLSGLLADSQVPLIGIANGHCSNSQGTLQT